MKKDDLHTGAGQPQAAPPKSDVALREEAILAFWQERGIFHKSIEKEAPNGDFVFYDGPPFATGLPHYGHILAGTIKDAIPRFWTMNGYRVRRKWGWDCHGLPLENLIEKKLGLATKRDIEDYGVKNFNEAAREAVLEYRDDWRQIIPRLGRFADMDDDYRTMDATYTESVWWVFSELHKKGLVYEGFKSMHLCPRCGTTLSNFEVNQGYKDIKDIAVTVKLPLVDEPGTSLLVWTTTPWTLPGNFAAAVHKDVVYAKAKVGDEFVILAKERLAQLGDISYEIVDEFKGEQLVGRSYLPPFDYWKDREVAGKENAWKIYHADYVEVGEEGTGAVHLAPAYGEDDMKLAEAHNVPIAHHVDTEGKFMDFIDDFECRLVKPKDDDDAEITHLDADIEVVRALAARGRLFKKENITHSYPHCWRCDTPLLNYATTSWFVRVTDIKDKLVAENNKVHWVPEHVGQNRFGRWLEGARDWAVSRQRYWGAPLPIWRNPATKEYQVFGSLADLTARARKSGNRYFLMRHGHYANQDSGTLNDDPAKPFGLSEKGRADVRAAAGELKAAGITKIISSPFPRAKETAEAVAAAFGGSIEVLIDERLREVGFGVFDGRPVSEYHDFFATVPERFKKAPEGGESWRDVKRRAGELLYELERGYQNETILIVSHNGTLWNLMLAAAGYGPKDAEKVGERDRGVLDPGEYAEIGFTPLPHNDDYELDFHRPYIDDYEVWGEGGAKLERVKDVFDCWFESGSMPYAQHHYPFENEERFLGELFPAQFIAEGLDQTRGWFYSLIVLGTALFGETPYKNVIVNGLIMAEDGKKLSKKLQNYSEPTNLADKVGADSMRFYLLSSPVVRAEDINFSDKEVEDLQRKNIGRLHNVLQMYEMYADGAAANADSKNVLDQWIVARLNRLIAESTAGYRNYELDRATRPITDFIDDLSAWYLRRSRERLKGEDAADKTLALGTLRFVLRQLSLVMAPSMPFYADYLWSRVKEEGDEESAHLSAWPAGGEVDEALLLTMEETRSVVTRALEARTRAGIKVRQPLALLKVRAGGLFEDLIKDEVNVKAVEPAASLEGDEVWLDTAITPELKAEGDAREFIRGVQELRKAKDLQPGDRIALVVQASDAGEAVVKAFEAEIRRVVGAGSIGFGDAAGEELAAGEHSFTVEINVI